MSNASLGSSPLHRLASYFERARTGAGTITLPAKTLDTIKQYREQCQQHSGREIDAIIRALGPCSTDVYRRLDATALAVICSVLVHAESCLAQQRGLCLIAETLHEDQGTSSQTATERRGKKFAIGKIALVALVKGFTKTEDTKQTRRWMGVLALELLRGCASNATLLQDHVQSLRSLNNIIEHERCQVLKLLSGSMIQSLLSAGIKPETIWPSKRSIDLYSQFPRNDCYETQWITSFEGFVEEMGHSDALPQEKTCVIFAFALFIGTNRYVTDDVSAIVITVSDELNIIIPNSATGPATYVDVPLDRVHSASVTSSANSQSQTPSYVLTMNLAIINGTTCYLNASGNESISVALAFTDEKDARTLLRLIQPKTVDPRQVGYYIQSEPLDISQQYSDDRSEDELAGPLSRDSQDGIVVAAGPASRLTPIRRQPSSALQHAEHSMLVATGVDVSWPAPPSDKQTVAAQDESTSLAMENPDQPHRTGPPSSPKRENINDSIEHARETARADALPAEVRSPQDQAEDYDNLYDVSPRGLENRPRPSLPQLPLSPNDNLNKRIDTSAGRLSKVRRATSVSLDAAANSNPEKPRATEPLDETVGPPTTGEFPRDKAIPQAISRGTTNTEGDLERRPQMAANPRVHPFSEQGTAKKTTSSSQLKRKAGVPEQVKPSKRLAVEKSNAGSNVEVSNKRDEYDLEPSPEPIQPTLIPAPTSSKMSVRGGQLQSSRAQISNAKSSAARLANKASHLGSKVASTAEGSKSRPQKEDGSKASASQATTGLANNKTSNESPVKKVKRPDARPLTAAKTKNPSRPLAKIKVGPKPAAAPLAEPRSRRAAAIKASNKLQGLDDSDEISDVDEPEAVTPAIKPPRKAKRVVESSAREPHLNEPVSTNKRGGKQAESVPQPDVHISRSVGGSKDNPRADPTPRKRKNPALSSDRKAKSGKEIDKMQESPLPQAHETHKGSRVTKLDKTVDRSAPSFQNMPMEKEIIAMEPKPLSSVGRDQLKGNERPKQSAYVDEIADPKETMAPDIVSQHFPRQAPVGMVGDTEDRHFQEAMPEIDPEPLSYDKAHDTAAGVTRSDMLNESDNPRQMKIDSQSIHIDQAPESGVTAEEIESFNMLASSAKPLPQDHKEAVATALETNGEVLHLSDAQRSPQRAKKPKGIHKPAVVQQREDGRKSRDHHRSQDPFEAKLGALFSKEPQKKSFSKPQGQQVKQPTKNEKIKETVETAPNAVDTHRRPLQQSTALPKDKSSEAMRKAKSTANAKTKVQEKSSFKKAHAINGVQTKAIAGEQASTSQTPLPTLSSKPGLISWTASGPRNQGTLSSKKRTPLDDIPARNTDVTKSKFGYGENDRKSMASFLDDFPPEHDQDTWHQTQPNGTPLHNPKAVPPMRPKLQASVVHEMTHRLSSQSTRVDANGSPIPCVDRFHQGTHHGLKTNEYRSALHDGQKQTEPDGRRKNVPKLPTVRHQVMPNVEDNAFASMTSNRKQVPSSPHAPSTLSTAPAHVILQNGDIVNRKTLESVATKVPQDPFIEGNLKPPSSFMKLLHKSTAAEKKRKSGDLEEKKLPDMNKNSFHVADDPDMTLVEPEPKRRKRTHRTVLVYSPSSPFSSSESTSEETPTNSVSDQESDTTTTRWRRALEPHQSNVLDALSLITHRLVRHLVDKETAAKDIVKDYEIGGNNLLQAYEKEHRQDLEIRAAGLQHEKKRLATMYTHVQASLHKLSKDLKKRSARALGDRVMQRQQQQQELDSAIENAIAACT